MNEKDQAPKRHFWLVAAEVVHHPVQDQTAMSAVKINTVLTTETPAVNAHDLGAAQAKVQQHLHMATQGREIKVVDVVIITLNHMGQMTDKEFFGDDPAESAVPAPTPKAPRNKKVK